jgi:hypothetical protein
MNVAAAPAREEFQNRRYARSMSVRSKQALTGLHWTSVAEMLNCRKH